jgi:FtsP/CotA-like multicopper oxidase with cupredoxin domain
MTKTPKHAMRASAAAALACLAVGAIIPNGAHADDRDDRVGRGCSEVGKPNLDPSAFPQPQMCRSSHGLLRTTLHACIGTNELVDQFPPNPTRGAHTPTFEGTIPGPTLSVKPGDKLSILLINDLPANPKRQRKGFFPHDPYTLNLHTHGLEVSPLGISDNIFREMKPGTAHQISVDIPDDHPTGTFWYHPHKHGSVTFQFVGGMAGFLLIKGGHGTLDGLLDDAGIKDLVMGFQIVRTTLDGGVPVPFVNQKAEQFGTFPFPFQNPPPTEQQQGIWSSYGLDGEPGRSFFYYTTNGVTNPTLKMRPGEVQRWRLLNASEGDNLLLALEDHGLDIVAMDGITVEQPYQLTPGDPVVIGPGQRMDVLVKAGERGTYNFLALDPLTTASVSPYRDAIYPAGIDPQPRASRHSFDFPTPCSAPDSTGLGGPKPARSAGESEDPCDARPQQRLAYPFPLATIVVGGSLVDMQLPAGPLPVAKGLPSVAEMLSKNPDAVRHSPSRSARRCMVRLWEILTIGCPAAAGISKNMTLPTGEVPLSSTC